MLAVLLATSLGLAQEPATEAPAYALDEATELTTVDSRTMAWLEPRRSRLPQNPYGHVDFTAYTLEWGEARLGLASMQAGVLPRTQVGTAPALLALGVQNLSAKVNPLRLGPVDLSVDGHHYRLPLGDFTASKSGWGNTLSVQVVGGWSLHGGWSHTWLRANGTPDVSGAIGLLPATIYGVELAELDLEARAGELDIQASAQATSVHVATDLRLNRRDSIVLQGQAMVWGVVDAGVELPELPPLFGFDTALEAASEGAVPISEAYVASAAWQFSWKHVDLRMGVGTSSVPGAWLLQSTELSIRSFGATRGQERRMKRGWRTDRRRVAKSSRRGVPVELL